MKEVISFREVQRPKSFFIMTIIAGITLLMWSAFIQQIILSIPFGDRPAPNWMLFILWIVFGILFPLGALNMKLITEVHTDGFYVKFIPFHIRYKKILFSEIKEVQHISYSPLARFGGWGIRFNFQGETAYTIGGNDGIELHTLKGTMIIESERAEELATCIAAQKEKNR